MRAPILCLAVLVLSFVSACAPKSTAIEGDGRSADVYRNADCLYLAQEEARIRYALFKIIEAQDADMSRDQLAAGIGAVFPPVLAILAASDNEEALAAMRGEFEAIREAMSLKGCAPLSISADLPGQAPPYPGAYATESLPVGAAAYGAGPSASLGRPHGLPGPRPLEGVRLADFPPAAMDAYCAQNWKRRTGPDGRTEYNPCFRKDVFR